MSFLLQNGGLKGVGEVFILLLHHRKEKCWLLNIPEVLRPTFISGLFTRSLVSICHLFSVRKKRCEQFWDGVLVGSSIYSRIILMTPPALFPMDTALLPHNENIQKELRAILRDTVCLFCLVVTRRVCTELYQSRLLNWGVDFPF